MIPPAYTPATLLGLVLSSSGLLLALSGSLWYWRAARKPLHLAYAVATGGWLAYLLGSNSGVVFQSQTLVLFLAHAACQLAIVALLFFFLISASVIRFEIHRVWMAQGLVGLVLLAWNSLGRWQQDWPYPLWVSVNAVCSIGLVGYGALRIYGPGSGHNRRWLTLGGSVLGLAICMADLPNASLPTPGSTLLHYLYAVFLLAAGLVIFVRSAKRPAPSEADAGAPSTAWSPVTGFGPPSDSVASAIAGERRRIARELHDGVCSQLVSILATLDARSPQQQAVALALEQCLVDVKLMVDVIDDADDSVIDALGRLRYRVQRGLDVLGIKMRWAVDVQGPLQNLRGDTAKQVLRIAQECLSNVMTHSQATTVEVVCSYLPAENFLLLEIRDNGSGIPRREVAVPGGKGLENMKKRALSIGGHLQIFTKPGAGTRVRLLVPLPAGNRTVPSAVGT